MRLKLSWLLIFSPRHRFILYHFTTTFLSGVHVLSCRWLSLPGCLFLGPPRGVVSHRWEARATPFSNRSSLNAWEHLISHVSIWWYVWFGEVSWIMELWSFLKIDSQDEKNPLGGLKAERKNIWRRSLKMNLNNGDLPFVFALVLLSWIGNSGHRWQNTSVWYGGNNNKNSPSNLLLFFFIKPHEDFLWLCLYLMTGRMNSRGFFWSVWTKDRNDSLR